MTKVFFISGVNGVGKSAIIPYLHLLLPAEQFAIHDFDARGVPDKADSNWRRTEAQYWLEQGIKLSEKNKSIVVCGFIKLTDLPDYKISTIVPILLSAEPTIIRERLKKRYTKDGIFDQSQKVINKPIDIFINDSIYTLNQMQKTFKAAHHQIIDTSNLSPQEVASKVANIIFDNFTK